MPVLDIRHLTIEIETPQGLVKAVDRMSFTINEGEIRGLVGESGSGKSLVAKAIVGVCKDNWRVTADRMRLGNIDLLQLTPRERRRVIARDVAMIFQEPSTCLDPSDEVGKQLIESIPSRSFEGKWWERFKWRKKQAIALLHKVGIKDHTRIMNSYPYELTDGECQKIMIAMAIATKPKLLIADEPTNDLDPITQSQILRLLSRMNQLNNTTIILIGHDLTTITQWATRITVMYCGQSVESAEYRKTTRETQASLYSGAAQGNAGFWRLDSAQRETAIFTRFYSTIAALTDWLPPWASLPYAQRQCVEIPSAKRIKNHKYSCHFPLNTEKKA